MGASLLTLQSRQESDPHSGALFTPAYRNVRPVEAIPNYKVPDPIRDGYDTPCRLSRWPIVTYQAISVIKSVAKDDFVFVARLPHHTAATPPGSQSAMRERANIQRTPSQAYGDLLMTLRPNYPY